MTDVRLTATNPDDSKVVPVACNSKGELKLEEPIKVPGPKGEKGDKGDTGEAGKDGEPFKGTFDGNVSFTGTATIAKDATIHGATVGCGGSGITTNIAVGVSALQANTEGVNNTAVGWTTLQVNTEGVNNTAVGHQALRYNTTANNNTAVGQASLEKNTIGEGNTAVGQEALHKNVEGGKNTAVGHDALYSNTAGEYNTAVGQGAFYSNTTGKRNTALGQYALHKNTVGENNTAVGVNAGSELTGSNNTFIGRYQGTANLNNTLSISTGLTERMRISADNTVDFHQKCGFTSDGGLWITDTRGNKYRTTFASNDFMQWEAYEPAVRNEPQLSDEEIELSRTRNEYGY